MKLKFSNQNLIIALITIILSVLIVLLIVAKTNQQPEVTDPTSQISNLRSLTDDDFVVAKIGGEEFNLEVARSNSKHQRGLMYVEKMDERDGMIFIFDNQEIKTFHMLNTYIPLDMLFINNDLIINTIHKNTKPLQTEELYWSKSKSSIVIELNGGVSDMINLSENDTIEILEIIEN